MSHISTRLCSAHRNDEVRRLRSLLDDRKPVICVTTQLIEAGVDISFRCVVRALAGIDSAAQAAGRCNRNGESGCRDVYVMELGEENLSRLPEISKAGQSAKIVCGQCRFDDILSPEAAAEYFSRYYAEMEEMLDYKANDRAQKSSLLDMLSLNQNRGNHRETRYTGQAFAEAGHKFEVIDNDTTSVLVPYNDEAREMISRLNGRLDIQDAAKLQRKAQKYTVGVYPLELKRLEDECAVYDLASGAFALKEGYYDKALGMVSKGQEENYIF